MCGGEGCVCAGDSKVCDERTVGGCVEMRNECVEVRCVCVEMRGMTEGVLG